ncbi:hypothetical protein EDB84DRAFT_1438197 [Lactarius hengduanensis]|nr:hypothetical protein EDB85DRAFT_1897001 [Lactarius pseudohatsudake]KAH9034161.1 hypothetical protein EDB84DRAFT_1438197 [Lactarius hengduanensis]
MHSEVGHDGRKRPDVFQPSFQPPFTPPARFANPSGFPPSSRPIPAIEPVAIQPPPPQPSSSLASTFPPVPAQRSQAALRVPASHASFIGPSDKSCSEDPSSKESTNPSRATTLRLLPDLRKPWTFEECSGKKHASQCQVATRRLPFHSTPRVPRQADKTRGRFPPFPVAHPPRTGGSQIFSGEENRAPASEPFSRWTASASPFSYSLAQSLHPGSGPLEFIQTASFSSTANPLDAFSVHRRHAASIQRGSPSPASTLVTAHPRQTVPNERRTSHILAGSYIVEVPQRHAQHRRSAHWRLGPAHGLSATPTIAHIPAGLPPILIAQQNLSRAFTSPVTTSALKAARLREEQHSSRPSKCRPISDHGTVARTPPVRRKTRRRISRRRQRSLAVRRCARRNAVRSSRDLFGGDRSAERRLRRWCHVCADICDAIEYRKWLLAPTTAFTVTAARCVRDKTHKSDFALPGEHRIAKSRKRKCTDDNANVVRPSATRLGDEDDPGYRLRRVQLPRSVHNGCALAQDVRSGSVRSGKSRTKYKGGGDNSSSTRTSAAYARHRISPRLAMGRGGSHSIYNPRGYMCDMGGCLR